MLRAALLALAITGPEAQPARDPGRLASIWSRAIEQVNTKHLAKPKGTESELAAKLPSKATKALVSLLEEEASEDLAEALTEAGQAALELALVEEFASIRARLFEVDPLAAAELGCALAAERFLLLGHDGLDKDYLEHFAEVFAGILDAYDEVFGFREWSKVPGKKLRVRVHLVDKIERPPHFAPQFPFHSEIDFPVIDPEALTSPTADGKFLFYGLCHELGHVIAMWGRRDLEEDHHTWAHYTGVTIVEHLSEAKKKPEWLKGLKDIRWRSLAKERMSAGTPTAATKEGTMALWIALHDLVGPEAIGAAMNHLDAENKRLRINQVRYYTLKDLERGFAATVENKALKRQLSGLLGR